jgi:hypothetical protein
MNKTKRKAIPIETLPDEKLEQVVGGLTLDPIYRPGLSDDERSPRVDGSDFNIW